MRVKVVGPLGALCEALYTSVANSRSWGFAADLIEGFCFASESKHSANNESSVAIDNLSHTCVVDLGGVWPSKLIAERAANIFLFFHHIRVTPRMSLSPVLGEKQ